MAMRSVVLVLACLTPRGVDARRVKAESTGKHAELRGEHMSSDRRGEAPNLLKSLASLLLASNARAAFTPSALRVNSLTDYFSSRRPQFQHRNLRKTNPIRASARPEETPSRRTAPTMFNMLKEKKVTQETTEKSEAGGDGLVAAGALASSAVIAEAVQIAGTALLFYFAQQWTNTNSPVEAVAYGINYIKELGLQGYGVFGATMVFLQVVPIAAAFVLTVSAGACFGAVKGTATVLTCSTISATVSFFIARIFGRGNLLEAAKESKQYIAIDRAFESASFGTSLTLITLLRLSPVLPFAWANYVFGLSPVPAAAFSIGTFVGCLPAVTAYVSAGQVGADVAINGVESDPLLIALGAAATLGAITLAGNVATGALKDMNLDLSEE
mmetsp:Transcript_136220/g.236851  ORF Transcript_136220/g.236851 Transcript_136220/m.236851 type:complete len:385 (-) Transcript_136220:136-1290(-)